MVTHVCHFRSSCRLGLIALLVGTATGCAGRSLTADNPVIGSTPPRRPLAVAAQTADADPASGSSVDGIEQASFSDTSDPSGLINQDISGVAATVNGRPILVADVLERFTPQLKEAEKQLPDNEFAKLKRQLIERELPAHIEQAVLVDSALSQLKAEQKEMVEDQLATFFAEDLAGIQAKMGAKSLAELEALLQREGTSITNLQRSFNNRQLAQQAMGLLKPKEPTVTRAELLKEYQARIDEFTEPEMVRWQQIWISYNKYGGKEQALEGLELVIQALKSGMPFDTVARNYSDGIQAADGGQWDWTKRGELANQDVERMLFELPVGEIGQVVEGDNAFQIIRVTERRPKTTKAFGEVQNLLGQEIKQKRQQEITEKLLADLKDKAIVTTMFDGDKTTK